MHIPESATAPPANAETAGENMMASPREFGVGARLTLAVMSDDYVDVILEALQGADDAGLDVQTGVVSTYIAGAENHIVRYLSQVVASAGGTGAHVSATVHLSRGCPGEVSCKLPPGGAALYAQIPQLAATGVQATAEWALYPLSDGDGASSPDHMRDIYAAIDYAKSAGVAVTTEHFVTRLHGDVAHVLQTITAGWILAGRSVQHVTTHATLSLNSPSGY